MTTAAKHHYKATESKYKGGAEEMYVTYDVRQETRAGSQALYPKVQRVYIAGQVKDWQVGQFAKRTGRKVRGVKIDYEQSRAGYERKGYTAQRAGTSYRVTPTKVAGGRSHFSKIVEVPKEAQNVHFYAGKLPWKYQDALQKVR
jgi:hypothetical protein